MKRLRRPWIVAVIVLVLAGGVYAAWLYLRPAGLPPGIAAGNGRIEAVEIDIATKIPGRIKDILADEGDFVKAGQVLAHMDTDQLEAQKREAQAQLQRATIAVQTAESTVREREAERVAAIAMVAQRQAELDGAQRHFERSGQLVPRGAAAVQTLDDDRARFEGAKAAVSAAQAAVAATEAAIGAAKSQVVDANAAVVAAQATIERIEADIKDSTLTSPRDGRIQYRVAQPGEVLPAGGRVLNFVDLSDVYMTFYLPTEQAGRVALGAQARIILDAAPQYVAPATISYVSDVAQFTPKTVETAEERQKLMFRIKARIAPELLRKYIRQVKTGLPGMAYVQLEPNAEWPSFLQSALPQ
ncbi:HlyD family secretion protein [Enhydrobacter aerosaccus]|uniref:HlyD family secretion protein n=1 Tax=Enhydrobacter aerosaccus TaxID=225324 RepID=A0A1T4TJ52_9HYPH|nr:HlyD family efflux transporter periplasmic adaptor subunit [Enhydrobacter aerosaccus]SKA40477.1 HlyD family secretion protein [Enhydrobacter aerosaccus]